MSKNSYKRDPAYAAFVAYMSEPFSELSADDAGRNDPRRMCFDYMVLPEELLFFLWKAASRSATDESAKPVWGSSTLGQLDAALDGAHELSGPPHERINTLIQQREEARSAVANKEAVLGDLRKEVIGAIRTLEPSVNDRNHGRFERVVAEVRQLFAQHDASKETVPSDAQDAARYRAIREIYRASGSIDAARESDEAFDARVDASIAQRDASKA